jgi:hypothetical protein
VLRSAFAIVAGFFVTVTLSLGADALVRTVWPAFNAPPSATTPAFLLVALVYTAGFATLGSYVAAASAPKRPLLHALILGAVALAINAAVTVTSWAAAPAWYHLTALVMVLPCAWIGGKLREQQLAHRLSRRAAV